MSTQTVLKPSSSTESLRKEFSWLSDLDFELASDASPSNTQSRESQQYQDEILGKERLNSIGSSLQSFYTANTSPSHLSLPQTLYTNSIASSNLSFPYSVTSINSYKSRKNVLYPRRAHPAPVTVAPEYIVSPDVLIWDVRFICATLLPHAETRLVPAATVLLRCMPGGPQGDLSQGPPNMNDDSLRCSEFFIVLTHEVFDRGAAGARELEGPCVLLHETFRDILFEPGAFVPRTISNSNAKGASLAVVQEFEQFIHVLRALCFVMDAFEGALNVAKPPAASDEALRERHRQALLKLQTSKGITMDQYRKELDQKLFQAQARLSGLLMLEAPNPRNSQAPLLSRPFRTPSTQTPLPFAASKTQEFYAVIRKSLNNKDSHRPIISTPLPPVSRPSAAVTTPQQVIRAISSYRSPAPQQLSFQQGDFFYVIREVTEGGSWYEAHNPITGARGLVPRAMFEAFNKGAAPNPRNSQAPLLSRPSRTPSTQTPLPPASSKSLAFYAVVLHDFVAERPDELDAKAGDSISVVAQSNREWFVAKSIGRLGNPGLIPVSFVEVRDPVTGKPIHDVGALMDNGTLPRVEDWKEQMLSYRDNSIPLGVLEESSQTPATASSPITNPSISMQPATPASLHEQLPLRQPSPPMLPDGLLLSASVVSFHYEMDEYWFRLHALYQPFDPSGSSTLPPAKDLVLFRAYNDFFDFQTALLETFPREGGREGEHPRVVPFIPDPSDRVDDELSATRQTELDDYLRRLCRLNRTTARYILEHHLTREFFALKPGDIEKETDPQYDHMKEVDWYDPSDDPEPVSINDPPSPVDDVVEKLRNTGIRSNGARHSDSEVSDYGDDSEAIAGSSKPGGYSQRQRSRRYSTSRTKLFTSGQSAPGAVGNGNGYGATANNEPDEDNLLYEDKPFPSSPSSIWLFRAYSPIRSSASAGGFTRSGRAASGIAGIPTVSTSNPHTAFIKIKVFDRIKEDLIAIRVHPRVTHEQLLDRVRQRLGGQVGRLSYRESSEDGEDYVPLQQDDDVLWWIESTDKHVLYAD